MTKGIDIMMTHDWPTVIGELADKKILYRIKQFFKRDIEGKGLGNMCYSLLMK